MFFTPTEPFTHHASFWGIPCYVADIESEGPTIAGTNVIFDWLILNVVPWCFFVVENIRGFLDPENYEPSGWPILIKDPINKDSHET